MASKTCINVNLVKKLIRLKPAASSVCAYSTLQRACTGTVKSLSANFGGSSLQSLPGNRLFPPFISFLQSVHRKYSTHIADSKVSWSLGVPGVEEVEDFTPLDEPQAQKDIAESINTCLEQGEAGRLFAVVSLRGIQHKVTTEDIIMVRYDFPPNVGDRIRLEKIIMCHVSKRGRSCITISHDHRIVDQLRILVSIMSRGHAIQIFTSLPSWSTVFLERFISPILILICFLVLAVGGKNFSLIGQPLLRRDVVRVEATIVEKTLSHNRVWFVYKKRKNFKKMHLYRDRHIMLVINSIQVARLPTPAVDESDTSQDLTQT